MFIQGDVTIWSPVTVDRGRKLPTEWILWRSNGENLTFLSKTHALVFLFSTIVC